MIADFVDGYLIIMLVQGKWKAPRIKNPAYKGKWTPRQIDNPIYFEPHPYRQMQHTAAIGFELWTMSANIVIDNVYIGTSEIGAQDFAKQTFDIKKSQVELHLLLLLLYFSACNLFIFFLLFSISFYILLAR